MTKRKAPESGGSPAAAAPGAGGCGSETEVAKTEVASRPLVSSTAGRQTHSRSRLAAAEVLRCHGYLRLVHARPSPMTLADLGLCPPTMISSSCVTPLPLLHAAQQRLAIAGLWNARLGAASRLSTDIAGTVALYICGFDHDDEVEMVREHGEEPMLARWQFLPLSLNPPGGGERASGSNWTTGIRLEGHSSPVYNDVYRVDFIDEKGWPVLKSARGMWCYRSLFDSVGTYLGLLDFNDDESGLSYHEDPVLKWAFSNRWEPYDDEVNDDDDEWMNMFRKDPLEVTTMISEGPLLPVGDHAWEIYADVEDADIEEDPVSSWNHGMLLRDRFGEGREH